MNDSNIDNLGKVKRAWTLVFDIPPLADSVLYQWLCLFPMRDIEDAFQRAASHQRKQRHPMTTAQIKSRIQSTLYWLKTKKEPTGAGLQRKKKLLQRFVVQGYSMEHLDFSGENSPPEYHVIARQRVLFRETSSALVELLIKEGRTDGEIVEVIMDTTRGNFRCTLLPELEEGETRRVLTHDEFRSFRRSREYESLLDEHDITVRLTLDGRWAVDVIAKSELSEAR
jgi:hypothetical protein